MLGKKLINAGPVSSGANTFASENFNTVLYTGNGSTQRIGGYINRGAVFNGSSSYIQVNSIPTNDTFSLSFWINATDPNSDTTLFHFYDSGNHIAANTIGIFNLGTQFGWFPHTSTGGAGFTGISASDTNALFDGSWHNVVIVSDANSFSNSKIYIDGVEKTLTISNSYTTSVRMEGTLYFGRRQDGYADYNGKIDQVRIFNKALSSSEVTTLYGETHSSTTISTTDIFNDNSGVALYQLDGNANDTGGVSGKFGSGAIIKNGGYITHSLTAPTTLSYSLWVKPNSFSVNSWDSTDFFIIGTGADLGIGGLMLRSKSDGYPTFNRASNVGGAITSNTAMNLSQWNHIVVTYSNGVDVKIYLNNVEVADSSFSTTQTSTISAGSANFFGAFATSVYNVGDFIIDDLRVYHDVLTSTEVGYIYNNTTASIPTDNLVAYYKFDGDARDEQQLYDGVATNVTYAYDGTATNVTYQEATSFTPDLIWIKSRSETGHHSLFDSVRGIYKYLTPNQTGAEIDRTSNSAGVTAFDSNGFSVNDPGGAGENYYVNQDNVTYAAWCFKGGGTAVSNTDGSITSQVSANQDAGFSIVKHTAPSSEQNYTIGHGLSQKPDMVILKGLDSSSSWFVWHKDLSVESYYLYLNGTFAESGLTQDTRIWGQQSFTDTVISTRANYTTALNQDYISYCFHSVDGYSKIGSYQGNGGVNHIKTDFEPAFIIIKPTSVADNWLIYDNKRGKDIALFSNLSNADTTYSGRLSFSSDGFIVDSSNDGWNGNNQTYIYLAIAADPDTTTPTVEDSFDVVTWTGNGSSQDIETDFKPDFVWVKERTTVEGHRLYDSVRGATKHLNTMNTAAEATNTGGLTSFDDGGFNIGNYAPVNTNGEDYVAWVWKAGDHDDNLPQINTEGSIDSVVSVNAEAGFSIVKYTGNGTAGATIGHGLSSIPQMIIIKNLDGTANWAVYTETTGTNATLLLNSTSASTSVSNKYAGTNSTVFGVNSASDVNTSGNEYIAYCFHSVSGYQKIGSYSGNGTDLSITGLGFQPRFLMLKRTDSTGNWVVFDNVRGEDEELYPNLSNAESNEPNRTSLDSDGFTVRSGRYNNSGSTFIYLAIK